MMLLAGAVLLMGCPPARVVPEDPSPRPIYPIPDTELIPEMCKHLKSLKCEEGDDYYDQDVAGEMGKPNQTCEKGFAKMQTDGFFVNPKCVLLVPSCDLIEKYRQKEPDTCKPDAG